MKKEYLNDIPVRVVTNNDTTRVIYEVGNFSGWCEYVLYEMKGSNKPILQRNWLLINTDMGDILEYLHKKSPLSSEDFSEVNMEIRNHSLSCLLRLTN